MSSSPDTSSASSPGEGLRAAVDATPLLGQRTGVGVFAGEVIAGLARHPAVTPVAYAISWRGRQALDLPAGVARVRRPMAARPLRAAWARFGHPAIELWTGEVDVVHGTNFVVPPSLRAARVVTVHDLTCVHFPELCTDDTRRFPTALRRAIAEGAYVHTVSQHVASEVVDLLGASADRVVAVPNGVRPRPAGEPGRGRLLAGAGRYMLAIGTVEPRKDLPSLVRAFDELAGDDGELRLVLAGAAGWGEGDLSSALASAHHSQRVIRLGPVDDRDRSDLVAGAAVLAYPSLYEGFGLPPLEAMAAEVPVVATRAGAIPEVVGDAALLVPPRDHQALAAALGQVLGDTEVRGRLIAAGRRRVDLYTWERTIEGLVGLYRQAADGR